MPDYITQCIGLSAGYLSPWQEEGARADAVFDKIKQEQGQAHLLTDVTQPAAPEARDRPAGLL